MIELTIDDMTCGGCVAGITRIVKSLDPAATLEADVQTHQVRIATPADPREIIRAISDAGYHPVLRAA